MNKEELENAFINYATSNVDEALSMITGLFVSLVLSYCEAKGGEPEKEVIIDGPADQRRITIHAEGE